MSPVVLITRPPHKEPCVDSRQIAKHLGMPPSHILETLKEHSASFEELGILRFETAESEVQFARLSEDQAYLLLKKYRHTRRSMRLRFKLMRAFRDSRLAAFAYEMGTLPAYEALQHAIHAIPGGSGPHLHSRIHRLVNDLAGVDAAARKTSSAPRQTLLCFLLGVATKSLYGATDAEDAYRRCQVALLPFRGLSESLWGKPLVPFF